MAWFLRRIWLLLLLTAKPCLSARQTTGVEDIHHMILSELDKDPLGDRDLFTSLSDRQKQQLSLSDGLDLEAKIRKLKGFEIASSVEIKLVGLDGDGNGEIKIREADLLGYLHALKKDEQLEVLVTEPHELAVRRKVHFHVSTAEPQLAESIHKAISSQLPKVNPATPDESLAAVPFQAVDDLLERSSESTQMAATIYLLNPKPQERQYAYTYLSKGATSGPGESAFHCLGNLCAGKGRVLWIDLAAGPVSYGPLLSGEGLVTETTFPNGATAGRGPHQEAFMAQLAALVWSAVRHTVMAPLHHLPVPFAEAVEVRLLHLTAEPTRAPSAGLNWKRVEQELLAEVQQASILLPGQSVIFPTSVLDLRECDLCTAALNRAIRVSTLSSQVGGRLLTEEYVDSLELHEHLKRYLPTMRRTGKIPGLSGSPYEDMDGRQVVLVVVYDLERETPLLLDREHQALAFQDMVIAVRTKTALAPTELVCNGARVQLKQPELTRPLIAAVLQTVWGVAPMHLTWSGRQNRSTEDLRWAVGRTPFGVLGGGGDELVSFAQRDAGPRNVLLSLLHTVLTDTLEALALAQAFGGEVRLFSPALHSQFSARWALLLAKLTQAGEALFTSRWRVALFMLRSARHDAHGLRSLISHAAGELRTSLACFTEPPTPWLWYASMAALGMGCGFLWLNRAKLLKVKSKRF